MWEFFFEELGGVFFDLTGRLDAKRLLDPRANHTVMWGGIPHTVHTYSMRILSYSIMASSAVLGNGNLMQCGCCGARVRARLAVYM